MDLRQELVYCAKIADRAGRSSETMDAMNRVAMLDIDLTMEERNLLSLGYKKVIAAKRASLHVLTSIELKEEIKGNKDHAKRTMEFRHKVKAELNKVCYNLIETIDKHLLPFSSGSENKVFYYKMKGDYYRYLAEFKVGTEKYEVVDHSYKAYEIASKIAEGNLSPADHIRLGLMLNISVFYYEIVDSPERACQVAKQAFDEAVVVLDSLNEDSYNDSVKILQILRDNLTLWDPDMDVDADDVPEWIGKDDAPGDSAAVCNNAALSAIQRDPSLASLMHTISLVNTLVCYRSDGDAKSIGMTELVRSRISSICWFRSRWSLL